MGGGGLAAAEQRLVSCPIWPRHGAELAGLGLLLEAVRLATRMMRAKGVLPCSARGHCEREPSMPRASDMDMYCSKAVSISICSLGSVHIYHLSTHTTRYAVTTKYHNTTTTTTTTHHTTRTPAPPAYPNSFARKFTSVWRKIREQRHRKRHCR